MSTQGLEAVAVAEWLTKVLSDDEALSEGAPGGVWHHPVPRDVGDAITVTFEPVALDLADTNANGRERVITVTDWLVRVSGPGSSPAAFRTQYARIDEILHGATHQVVSTGRVESCHRVSPFWMVEDEPAEGAKAAAQWAHLGGIYRCIVAGS